ncbi:homoserine O-succinyltransferase [Deferribacterales bacterium]|nr:homoserine O-succinyltransferase [Deferribacterales bacterium]
MPINIPLSLPARSALEGENVFVMTEERAIAQDIRPLEIVIVNLMPTTITTELQLLRLLSNSPLQVNITLISAIRSAPKHAPIAHLKRFYTTFDDVRNKKFDGMIITGAPVGTLRFEEIEYWKELTEIMDYSQTNVFSTVYICWGAVAGLYHHFGIEKHTLKEKLFGVYEHRVLECRNPIFRGFDDKFYMPHSRYANVLKEDISANPNLKIIADFNNPDANIGILKDVNRRQLFVLGHMEYDACTLGEEYRRDIDKGLTIDPPLNYYPQNNPALPPVVRWRAHASLFYSNWLNFYVYQDTPYELDRI